MLWIIGAVPPLATAAYDPHQPVHPTATATAINSSHSINDINLSMAMDNADRQAFAALYGPSQTQGSSTANNQSIPLSSSQYQSQTPGTNSNNNTTINSSKNTNTVFIPPPPPPPQPSSSAESSDSSSSLSQHNATSTSPLLPTTHIDVDID